MQSSLFYRFSGGQFQDIPQLTYAEARLIRSITEDKRDTIKYEPLINTEDIFANISDESRLKLTIDYSGPTLLADSFGEYCDRLGIRSSEEMQKFTYDQLTRGEKYNVLGTIAISHSDATWVEKKSSGIPQRFFYDDSSVRYSDTAQTTGPKRRP